MRQETGLPAESTSQELYSPQSNPLPGDDWQHTLDCIPDLIAILDTEHRIVKVNRAMREKLEHGGNSIIGQHCFRHLHNLEAPPEFCPHARLLDDGNSHTEETFLPLLDGHYSITVTPLHDAAGKLTGCIHIAHDITVRKQTEEALRDSEERYRMFFNEALIGICMADAETGIIIDCNQAFVELTGRSFDNLIGSHQTSLHPPEEGSLPFSTTFLQHKKDASGHILQDRIITASGEMRDVEIKARTFVFRDRPILLGTFNDISERKWAEAALRENKEHYKSLYHLIRLMCDNVPDLIWAKDLDQRYIFANKAMCEILLNAEHPEEPVGKTDMFFTERERTAHAENPDWHTFGEICMDSDTLVMKTKHPGRFEESGNIKGAHLCLDVAKSPFLDEQGTMIGTVGCGRDVTRLKQLEEEQKLLETKLRHASDDWRRTFDTIPDIITIIDSEHRIIRANRATWQKLGCEKEDLLGKPCSHVFHGLDTAPVFCPHAQLMQNGVSHTIEVFQPVLNSYLNVTVTPFCDPDGTITGSIHVAHDITDLKHTEESLRKSETLYRSILMASPDTIVITDLNGSIRIVSPAGLSMFGYAQVEDVFGRSIEDFIVPEDRERAKADILTMFQGIFTGPDEYRALRPDGGLISIEANGDFILNTAGQPESMIFVIRDITERKQVESALNRTNNEIEQFIYTVSHDLRSPLVTVKTFLGYLEQDISNADAARIAKDIDFIGSAANRMEALLNELLDMSRIGRISTHHEQVTFQELAAEAMDALAGQINTGKVNIKVSDGNPVLYGDRRRLLQVWQNLLDNALKYLGDKALPCIHVGIEQQSGETVFFVRDNGIGIDPSFHEKIFGIFEQLDRRTGGVGMGLTMIKRIVEMYAGRIWVESRGAGTGACFSFTLPKAMLAHKENSCEP